MHISDFVGLGQISPPDPGGRGLLIFPIIVRTGLPVSCDRIRLTANSRNTRQENTTHCHAFLMVDMALGFPAQRVPDTHQKKDERCAGIARFAEFAHPREPSFCDFAVFALAAGFLVLVVEGP
jgi:hypothetical protein